MTQNYVAVKAQAANTATDQGSNNYQLTVSIADDSGVYNGTDIALGMKLLKEPSGGNQMRVYDITAVSGAFVGQVTITVNDPSAQGNPGFGNFAIVEPSSSSTFPVPAGVAPGLQQAISQYNLDNPATGDNIYTADGTLTANRTVTMGGNALVLDGGDLERTGGEITTATDSSRWRETTNELGVTVRTKLP